MNTTNAHTNWSEVKGKIAAKWNKFSESEIETFKDNMDKISDKIQSAYGYSKEKAEQEYSDFKKTMTPEKAN